MSILDTPAPRRSRLARVELFLSPGVQVTRPLVHGTSLGLQIGAYRRIELRRIAHHFAPVLRLEPGILVIARPVKAGETQLDLREAHLINQQAEALWHWLERAWA